MQRKPSTELISKPDGLKSKSGIRVNPARVVLKGSIADLSLQEIADTVLGTRPDLPVEMALELARELRARMQRTGTTVWKPEHPNRKTRRVLQRRGRERR